MKKKNVFVIGSGRRVQSAILPALACLNSSYRIAGIYSQSIHAIRIPGTKITMWTSNQFSDTNFSDIDLIIIAIPPSQVIRVGRELLSAGARHCIVFVDTPVLALRDVLSCGIFSSFRAVYVSEDYRSMLCYDVAARLIKRGYIGTLKHVYLFHSGYKYHAIAVIKKLTGCQWVRAIRRVSVSREISELRLRLPGGVGATIVEPRDYSVGRFLIVGEKGCISDYPIQEARTMHLSYLGKGTRIVGFRVSGAIRKWYSLHPNYRTEIAGDASVSVPLQNQKIEGLVRMYASIWRFNSSYKYAWYDGLYDSIVSSMTDRLGWFWDTGLIPSGESTVKMFIRLLGRINFGSWMR